MTFPAQKLVDWHTATLVGERVAGAGTVLTSIERARLAEDFAELVPEAERLVERFTGLSSGQAPARAWVMTRGQWLQANLRAFERMLEPFAKKLLSGRSEGALASVRRNVLGAQLGALLGYVGHRVLGQYDMFLPPDDDGLLYIVGANVAGVERKFGFHQRDFRLWISSHEVTHRVQFGAAPWLRGYLTGLMDTYLSTVEVDPAWLLQRVRQAIAEVRSGSTENRGFGWVFLLMTTDQRDMVRKMQAVMSLLEGHANFVMDGVSPDHIPGAEIFQRRLHERRNRGGFEGAFHKAIGLDVKMRQYDLGHRFVTGVVEQVGMGRFNRVWDGPDSLPSIEEIARPDAWVARVAAS